VPVAQKLYVAAHAASGKIQESSTNFIVAKGWRVKFDYMRRSALNCKQ